MPRHRGQIWEYFEEETLTQKDNDKDVEVNLARCKDCGKHYFQVLDSRQTNAETILKNLGFTGGEAEGEERKAVPERFFEKPSAANGINTCQPITCLKSSTSSVNDLMVQAFQSLCQLLLDDKKQNMTHRCGSKCEEEDEDEVDQGEKENENPENGQFFMLEAISQHIRDIFESSPKNLGGCSTSPAGSPLSAVQPLGQIVRPALKETLCGTRYLTILQPENSDYLNSIGYYDTMPSVSEPGRQLETDLQEKLCAAVAKLQEMERPFKKHRKCNGDYNDDDDHHHHHHYHHNDGDIKLLNSDKAPADEQENSKSDSNSHPSGEQKLMSLPSRFLCNPSLLGSISQFVPEVNHNDYTTSAVTVDQSPIEKAHNQQYALDGYIEVQNKTNSDESNDDDDDDDDDGEDILYRFSESSYSCAESSCSSLPREDVDLQRYYMSKNMLRVPTADMDEVGSCISDRTATNETEAQQQPRSSSFTEEAEIGVVADEGTVFPNISDFKKKFQARMIRQASSHSDSSGFGDGEFVDVLSSHNLSKINRPVSILCTGEQVNSLIPSGREVVSDDNDNEGRLCPSCLEISQSVLKVEAWSQTVLSFLDDEKNEKKNVEIFRSEFVINDARDTSLSSAPISSEVCLLVCDAQKPLSAGCESTTINIRVSKSGVDSDTTVGGVDREDVFHSRDFTSCELNSYHSDLERKQSVDRSPIKYDLILNNSIGQQLLSCDAASTCKVSANDSHYLHPHISESASSSPLHPQLRTINSYSLDALQDKTNCNFNKQQLFDQMTHLMESLSNYRTEVKILQLKSFQLLHSGKHDLPTSPGKQQNQLSTYNEILHLIDEIDQVLTRQCTTLLKNYSDDTNNHINNNNLPSNDDQMAVIRDQMNLLRNNIELLKHPLTDRPSLTSSSSSSLPIHSHQSSSLPFASSSMSLPLQINKNFSSLVTESENNISRITSIPPKKLRSTSVGSTRLTLTCVEPKKSSPTSVLATRLPSTSVTATELQTKIDVEKRLVDLEKKLQEQLQNQDFNMKLVFKEFKDSLIAELKGSSDLRQS